MTAFSTCLAFILPSLLGHVLGLDLKMMPDFDLQLGEKLNADFWRQKGAASIQKRIKDLARHGLKYDRTKAAKNVILFIGDGFGVSSVTAARKYKQEVTAQPFYETELAWDSFPFSALSKTYEIDGVIPDSAGTATAYHCGTKTRYGFIGVDGSVDLTCATDKGHVDSIAHWAKRAGKSAGFVTTTTITHASPSPLYAHMPGPLRDYEFKSTKFKYPTHSCVDIAQQFVASGQHLKVAMGGGRGFFLPSNVTHSEDGKAGLRSDGLNLIDAWKADRMKHGENVHFVANKAELDKINPEKVDYLLGLFNQRHLEYVDNKTAQSPNEPKLDDMAEAAIKVLRTNKNGYFLFIEGGRIDHGHHMGIARYALTETLEFNRALEKVLSMVDLSETLIVVSADHSHTFTMGGYLRQTDSILSLSLGLAEDNKTWTSLGYANGPGAGLQGPEGPFAGSRPNETEAEVSASGYHQQSRVLLYSETHGGEDVPVFATGVHAELFSGVIEQNYIAMAMACASGIPVGLRNGRIAKQMSEFCSISSSADLFSSVSTATKAETKNLYMAVAIFFVLLH